MTETQRIKNGRAAARRNGLRRRKRWLPGRKQSGRSRKKSGNMREHIGGERKTLTAIFCSHPHVFPMNRIPK